MLLDILDKSKMNEKEKNYRKNELIKIYEEMKKTNTINNKYYNLSHEIRSLEFLQKYENLRIAQDHSHKAGCDFKIYDNYEIECVCSSSGQEETNGLNQFHGSDFFDYNKKENIILTRLTSSIKDKLIFYHNHLNNGSISSNKNPYIIFLGLGNLKFAMFPGKFGFVLNKILFGVGHENMHINKKTNKVEEYGYSHNNVIYNHNNKEINCNIFCDTNYDCVSGIIFSTAKLDEHYTKDNTFLFINPFAKNPIYANKFSDLVYWKAQHKENNHFYIPRYKGKNLNDKLSKKYW